METSVASGVNGLAAATGPSLGRLVKRSPGQQITSFRYLSLAATVAVRGTTGNDGWDKVPHLTWSPKVSPMVLSGRVARAQ